MLNPHYQGFLLHGVFMIQINPDFQKLIPPLSTEEKQQLESNIIADGCRDPLVLWGDMLIDGHNRYEICTRLNLPFQTVQKAFDSGIDAKIWMLNLQRGRRNATPEQLSYMRGKRYELEKLKGTTVNQYSAVSQNVQQHTHEKLATEYDVSPKTIQRDAEFTRGIDAIESVSPEIKETILSGKSDIKKQDVQAIAKEVKAIEKEVIETSFLKTDAEIKEEIAEKTEEIVKKHVHVAQNSGENEWYTPAKLIESARHVMGSISLDPATSEIANKTVGAESFFTKDDNGLEKQWHGNVWMNPPYAQPLMNQFAEKLISELDNINQAIALVNNATETKWLQSWLGKCDAVCFPSSRIKFLDPQGNATGAPLQGQAILYFGQNKSLFSAEFSQYGAVFYHA